MIRSNSVSDGGCRARPLLLEICSCRYPSVTVALSSAIQAVAALGFDARIRKIGLCGLGAGLSGRGDGSRKFSGLAKVEPGDESERAGSMPDGLTGFDW